MRLIGRKRQLPRRVSLTISWGVALVVLVVWSSLSYGRYVDPFFLPSPTSIAKTIYLLFAEHGLITDIWVSIARIMVAFTLSAVLAIPIGIAMSISKRVEAAIEPPIDFIRYLPVPALVPLMILWIGIGEGSKIALLFVGTFFQLVLLVMDDAENVPAEYCETAYTLGASHSEVIRRALWPAMLPSVWDDLRICLGWCWTYLLIGEIVAARTGLGHVIQEAQRFAKPEVVMSGVLLIGIIGLVTDILFKICGRKLFPYRTS